ncbi:hypothetical protein HFP89_06555 [Wenzhouxiangella sp. XN79A]|uniref:hypothetical protein n=1 Tax=Wenzhouxiangella sp. XN79A TaxID=2724193 RepID=UPI00144ADF29|nr:hypothetical protein [Wenzhouxiangella sp. XN79A]NKI34823.1 hypothetical protein [Wenzhouxiangella sp. XN79A]
MSDHRTALVIVLPVLDAVLDGELACPPILRSILTRGRIRAGGGDAALAESLGFDTLPAAGPRAALAAGDEPPPGSRWLRADPVSLMPDLTAVWLRGPAPLDWDAPSMAPLNEALAETFAHAGLDWRAPATGQPGRLRLDEHSAVQFTDLIEARGRRLDEILPRGDGAGRWHGLINEIQMVFHQFRALDDPSPGGYGLWFWGAGLAPQAGPPDAAVARLLRAPGSAGDDGLAGWLGRSVADLQADWRPEPGLTLVEAEFGDDAAGYLTALDDQLLAPAWAALKAGRLDVMTLVGSRSTAQAGRWAPLALWRRSPPEGLGS